MKIKSVVRKLLAVMVGVIAAGEAAPSYARAKAWLRAKLGGAA